MVKEKLLGKCSSYTDIKGVKTKLKILYYI